MSKDNSGQAFPGKVKGKNDLAPYQYNPGLTIRQWYAGQALAGMMANTDLLISSRDEAKSRGMDAGEAIAATCYEQADSMIAERDK